MALLDAVLPLASSRLSFPSLSFVLVQKNVRFIRPSLIMSNRRLSGASASDIEESDDGNWEKNRAPRSLFHRFRKKKGLSVADITATEWWEKQMEFGLLLREKRITKAMRAGTERHKKLEQEVVKKVKFQLKSAEERWAVRFMNFITGANQLLFDGLTRELPLIGFIQGAWMVGVLDQIQIPVSEPDRPPILIDTKTRTLDEIVRHYRNTCKMLPPANRHLLLRYELQKDHSLLGEHLFEYDLEFVEGQIKTSLEFWLGGREATYTPKEERWKCRSCQFALMRPVITGNNKGCSSF